MASGSTLHVSGFPRGVGTRDLAPDFENIGRVVRIEMPPARSEFARPYAFVEYETPEEAQEALHRLNQQRLSFDPQILITVQFARSEARPSRFSGSIGRHTVRGGTMPREHDYPRRPREHEFDSSFDGQSRFSERNFESGQDDEFHHRRAERDDFSRGKRGAYGPRSYRSQYRSEHAVPRRELSPARMRADDGPAPYQDVLHNNAAALKKPRYSGSVEKSIEQDDYFPAELNSKDVEMTELASAPLQSQGQDSRGSPVSENQVESTAVNESKSISEAPEAKTVPAAPSPHQPTYSNSPDVPQVLGNSASPNEIPQKASNDSEVDRNSAVDNKSADPNQN
ncbi:LADA_0C05600g1_1 [Lachancea dasiensis]|uniref:LADA_0C05600g1_1 n=1 Tax=Lachancea dasiensis TaxID=1072105 RepID=A0A1G4IZ09_9SACH|nr:LADA_0C05600g1_1 [Lachancea dasiensis]